MIGMGTNAGPRGGGGASRRGPQGRGSASAARPGSKGQRQTAPAPGPRRVPAGIVEEAERWAEPGESGWRFLRQRRSRAPLAAGRTARRRGARQDLPPRPRYSQSRETVPGGGDCAATARTTADGRRARKAGPRAGARKQGLNGLAGTRFVARAPAEIGTP